MRSGLFFRESQDRIGSSLLFWSFYSVKSVVAKHARSFAGNR